MSSLLFIVYASSATRPFSADGLTDLLNISRRNNTRDDLSGLLLHRGGNFMQALEGPEQAVRKTMLRIARDPRHRSVITLVEEWREERLFADWAMAFDEVSQLDSAHPGASAYLQNNTQHSTFTGTTDEGHDVFEFFRSFRDHIR